MMAASDLTAARLRELLLYDPLTGVFTRRVAVGGRNGKKFKAGTVAGCLAADGYRLIRIDGVLHKAHRLAWLYVQGAWPETGLDHRFRSRDDNRIGELREGGQSFNTQNLRAAHKGNTSGYLGVSWNAASGKWMAQIKIPGRKNNLYLGLFDDPAVAHEAYLTAKREHHAACTI